MSGGAGHARWADRGAGLAAAGLGVAAGIGARRLPAEAEFGLGAAFLPFWLGVILTGLGLTLALRPAGGEAPVWPIEQAAWARLAATLGLLALYVGLLEPAGYAGATLGFLFLATMVLGPRRWPLTLLLSALATAGLLVVFRVWLKAPLPRGPWGF